MMIIDPAPAPEPLPAAQKPRVTVVIPYFNAAWSIDRTIRSIIAQTYRDFEVVLIDDGSTESTPRFRDRYGQRLRTVHQENRGLAGARNRGIAESRGDLVAPIDADDLWHPDFLRLMVDALDAAPAAPFSFADSHRVDEHDYVLPDRELHGAPRVDFEGLLSLNTVRSGSGAVYRREAIAAVGGYDESLRRRDVQGAEDWKLVVALSAIAPPIHVRKKLVAYRLSRNGMSQARPERQLAAVEAVIADLRRAHPSVRPQLFRDARTMMIAWLLPAFLHNRRFAQAALQMLRAYALNPAWWRNRELRRAHVAWLRTKLRTTLNRDARTVRLVDLHEDGAAPFSFLAEAAEQES